MNAQVPSEDRFHDIPPMRCADVSAQLAGGTDCRFIEITCQGYSGENLVSIPEARALRDWLNKVLP